MSYDKCVHLSNCHHDQDPEHSHHSSKLPCAHCCTIPNSTLIYILSLENRSSFSRFSYKCNHRGCTILHKRYFLKIMLLRFIHVVYLLVAHLFYWQIVLCCMDIPHFIFSALLRYN